MSTNAYPWLKDLDRAALLVAELGREEAARMLNDPRDWAAFCATRRLCLDEGEVQELRALLRA